MRRLAGQAGRIAGHTAHHTGRFVFTLFILVMFAAGGFAWRLDHGPIALPFVAELLGTSLSSPALVVHIDRAALAWEGFRQGGGAPLDLRLAGLSARTGSGTALVTAQAAQLEFKATALMGSGAPIEITTDRAALAGGFSAGPGAPFLEAPVRVQAQLRLGVGLHFTSADLAFRIGAGTLALGGATLPIRDGAASVSLTPDQARIHALRVAFGGPGASAPVLSVTGQARLARARPGADRIWRGHLDAGADALRAADLADFWPPAYAVGARRWVTRNITAGTATDGTLHLDLAAPRNLSSLMVTGGSGGFDATGLTIQWLPGEIPITGLSGHLALPSLGRIAIASAAGASAGGLALGAGRMTIDGLEGARPVAHIALTASGPVASAYAIIGSPPLRLLARLPAPVRGASGAAQATLAVTLPLLAHTRPDDLTLEARAALHDVTMNLPGRLTGASLALTNGDATLRATMQAFSLDATAMLDRAPATIAASATFGPLPAFHLDAGFALTPALVARFGADPGQEAAGAAPASLRIDGRHFALHADLAPMRLAAPDPFGWSKKRGAPGSLDVTGTIGANDRPVADSLAIAAPGLSIVGARTPDGYRIDRFELARTAVAGRIAAPAAPGAPWRADLSGSAIDLAPFLQSHGGAAQAGGRGAPSGGPAQTGSAQTGSAQTGPAQTGPAWTAHIAVGTLYLAPSPAPAATAARATISGSGQNLTTGQARFTLQGGATVLLSFEPDSGKPEGGGTHLGITTSDGGALLRALAAAKDVQGGALALNADTTPDGTTTGTATLDHFTLGRAPGTAKLLQGISAHGVKQADAPSGLEFDRLIAPFSKTGGIITLHDGRAYSTALGFTAEGTIDLATHTYNLDGTIVPAYAVNTLLGRIPLIGRLFSPEKGGGLIALRYSYKGPADAPVVSVNPLSVLTPGALREVFGIFPK